MRIVSCFSGIGGLEGANDPIAVCEIDSDARTVLSRKFPKAEQFTDVLKMSPPEADVVIGGWPCQDLSIAGAQEGLSGKRSVLFYELLRIANEAHADSIVAENVPNLLRLNQGREFYEVLLELTASGYPFISWRLLNAREFGLPQERRRVFIVASKNPSIALALHRDIPEPESFSRISPQANGFYWTAGIQGMAYSRGYSPTIKVGSALDIESPPAVHNRGLVRKLSPEECLNLQGTSIKHFAGISKKKIYKFAGNAVALPVGKFAVETALQDDSWRSEVSAQMSMLKLESVPTGGWGNEGHWADGNITPFHRPKNLNLATDLHRFLVSDPKDYLLSPRAIQGLIKRMEESGKRWPDGLLDDLKNTHLQVSV